MQWPVSLLNSEARIEDRAGEEIRPVALEERSLGAVVTPDGPHAADEFVAIEPNKDLFGTILDALGTEPKVLQRRGPGERDFVSVRSADSPRPPASSASPDVKRKRREHRLGGDRHLPPLQRSRGLVGALESDASLADRAVERARVGLRPLHVRGRADDPCIVAHAGLHLAPYGVGSDRALGSKDGEDVADAAFDEVALGRGRIRRITFSGDVLGAAGPEDLTRVEGRAAGTGHAVRARRFADRVAALEARLRPTR